jgi:2-amino-4-hydroxy-6-hydroxymethyldihydropteridine diphosphokinase
MANIYISLGTNIDRDYYLRAGLQALTREFGQLTLSSLFESEAVGFQGEAFYNMVIHANTERSLAQVVTLLRQIEFAHGREINAKKYAPRTLDLDLLLYDSIICEQPAQLPRDEITKNAFVLWPLSEIAPDLKHPILQRNYAELWQAFNKSTQHLRRLPFNWPK